MNRSSLQYITIIIAAFPVLIMLSCAGPGPGPAPTASRELRTDQQINREGLEYKIHELVNKERRSRGLSSLSLDDTLARIAGKHSRDMARRKFFDHQSPDGQGFPDRYRKEGYSCAVQVKEMIYGGAENIFQNTLYDRIKYVNGEARYDWNPMQKIAETTVQGWMDSPGHRKNILAPHWRREGIGVFITPDGKVYITQNFC